MRAFLEDRAYGCLAGLALGDALGMPTEMLTPEAIKRHFGALHGLAAAPEWHPHARLQPGRITDDTGQALAIARAYDDQGRLTPENVARQLLAWADGLPPPELDVVIGPTTRQALLELRQGKDPRSSGQPVATNGAAMRVVAAGLVNAADFDGACQDAITASLPTHRTGAALAGATAVACAVAEAVRPGSTCASILQAAKAGAPKGLQAGEWAWSTRLEKRIELAERLVQEAADVPAALQALYDYVGVSMLAAESVAAAFGIVLLAEGDPSRAIHYGANIGGDTDTIAAIAGAICGAWQGIAPFDADLLAQVETVNQIDLKQEARRLASIAANKQGWE